MEDVVAEHPETEVGKLAEEMLKRMAGTKSATPASEKPNYLHDPSKEHIYILSLPNRSAKSNELKNKVSNFNQEFFREAKLNFTTTTVKGRKLFLIRTFTDQKQAMRYLRAIRNQLEISLQLKQEGGRDYIISTENFRLLFQTKNEEDYLEFFLNKYPS